jgi:ankyrin repeat protein
MNCVDVNLCKHGGKTLLQTAVSAGDADVVAMLLDHGADANSSYCGPYGIVDCLSELCHMPTQEGRYDIAVALMANGANMYTEFTGCSFSILQLCCARGDLEFVQLMFKNGLELGKPHSDMYTEMYITPMVLAARNSISPANTVPLMELLVKNGANIHSKDRYGHTLLHSIASNHGQFNYDAVQYLVDHGVRDLKDKDNMSASDLAEVYANDAGYPSEFAKEFGYTLSEMIEENDYNILNGTQYTN